MIDPTDKTQAIVLTTTPINDRSQLVRLYTQQSGRVTCRVPLLSRGRQASQLRIMMAPMTLIEAMLVRRPHEEIGQIADAQIIASPYALTQGQPDKAASFIFMAELLAQTVREEECNPTMWDYLTASLQILQYCDEDWENFYLIFTAGLTSHLGFQIDTDAYTEGCYFDMQEGIFTPLMPRHPYYFNPLSTHWWHRLLTTDFSTMRDLQLDNNQRIALLEMQLSFLSLHIPEMGRIKSLEMLKCL